MRMNKNEKKALVPKLRFKEYDNAKQWRVISLIDIVDKNVKWSFTGGPFGSNLKSSDYKNEGIRVIQLQNIGDAEFINDYKIFTFKEKADELISCNIYPHEIIMSKMGDPVGRACIIPNFHPRYLMCSDGIRLVVDEKYYSKYFIYSLINSKFFRSIIESHSTGSTRKRIGLEVLKNLQMAVPEKEEQQKIADCLFSLDDLITAENEKLKALKEHKKGLMQKLFPAEGETVPEWRFPEFRGSGEWEEKKVTYIAKTSIGLVTTMTENYVENGVMLIRNSDIKTNRINKDNLINLDVSFAEKNRNRKFQEFDIVTVHTGDIGVSAVIDGDMVGSIGFATLNTRPNKKIINPYFLCWYYNSPRNINFAIRMSTGDGRNNYNLKDFDNAMIPFPSLSEQQKIADCLSSVDTLINVQTEKIEALIYHKKGLMQGLFPSIEEVGK